MSPVTPAHIRIVAEELQRRHARNPRYSLRAFSRSLGIHCSTLSRILSEKQDLSLQACAAIFRHLDPEREGRVFLDSVAEEHKRKMIARVQELAEIR